MKLDWFSPLPPAPTAIAAFAEAVLPILAKHAEVTVWAEQPTWDPRIERHASVHRYETADPPWEELNRGDLCIYHLDNDAGFHEAIWRVSCRHPGLVVLHNVHLHDFLHGTRDRDARSGRGTDWERWHGTTTSEPTLEHGNGRPREDPAGYGSLAASVLEGALGVLVHTRPSFDLIAAQTRCPVAYAPLPFAMTTPTPPHSAAGTGEPSHTPERYVDTLLNLATAAIQFRSRAVAWQLAERAGSQMATWLDGSDRATFFTSVARAITSLTPPAAVPRKATRLALSHPGARPVRVGIFTDGLVERQLNGRVEIANGGVGVYIYNLVRQLQQMEGRVDCVLIRSTPGALDIYDNGRSQTVMLTPSRLQHVQGLVDRTIPALVSQLGLDVLHYPNQFGGGWLPPHVPRVVTLHDLTPLLFPQHHPWRRVLGYRLLLRRCLRVASHVIVVSDHTRRDVLARRLAAPTKVSVVLQGVGEQFRPDIRTPSFAARYQLPERFILNVGVLEPRKNHVRLLHALAALHAAGEQLSLVLVGRDGWNWTDPLADPALAHLRPWVHILRNVPDADLAELYCRAELFVYPSLYEGFGLPLLEAMACGTPVVASRAASLPQVVGTAALLIDPYDSNELAQALVSILRDPPLRARLIAAGQQRAAELSWRQTAERTLQIYEKVCGREAQSGFAW